MPARDPWHRRRLYDGDPYWQALIRWTIAGVRLLALPTAGLALLLGVDAFLPGPTIDGIAYTRASDSRLLGDDRIALQLVRLGPPDCSEQRDGRTLLFANRPGCSATVSVAAAFGRRVGGRDTLQVVRSPLFGWVSEVRRPDGLRGRGTALPTVGLYVLWGLVPLLSFGEGFAHSPLRTGTDRRLMVYVVPALLAEATYVVLLVQAFG